MGAMNELFVSVHEALNRASIRDGEFQSLQTRLEEREGHISQLETLEGSQAMEISKLKEEVKRLESELKGHDQGMKTLMAERADLVNQVMNWEAEVIAAKDFLKEAELTRGLDIANEVDESLTKFKNSDEFTALLKKDHDAGFDAGVELIFYNIWAHYWDLDYTFLGGKLIYLIGEWLEEERLNAPNVVLPSALPGPSTACCVD